MLSGESCQYTAQEDLEYSELRETSTYLNSVAGAGSVVACASLTLAATSAAAAARQRRVHGREDWLAIATPGPYCPAHGTSAFRWPRGLKTIMEQLSEMKGGEAVRGIVLGH